MPLSDLNEMLAEIRGISIETDAGLVVPLTGLRRLMEQRSAEAAPSEEEPPKNMDQARQMAKQYLKDNADPQPPTLGRAIAASTPSAS